MRTTILIDDYLKPKLKGLASKKGLSRFINRCLYEHFEMQERAKRLQELEKAYQRCAQKTKARDEFEGVDVEDWPEW